MTFFIKKMYSTKKNIDTPQQDPLRKLTPFSFFPLNFIFTNYNKHILVFHNNIAEVSVRIRQGLWFIIIIHLVPLGKFL